MTKVNIAKAWVTWASIGIGQTIFVLYDPDYALPLGFVWGVRARGQKLKRFEVYGSYVLNWARRQGVRKRINQEILKQFDIVSTLSGSKTGGKAFMKATGYTYNKDADVWYRRK